MNLRAGKWLILNNIQYKGEEMKTLFQNILFCSVVFYLCPILVYQFVFWPDNWSMLDISKWDPGIRVVYLIFALGVPGVFFAFDNK